MITSWRFDTFQSLAQLLGVLLYVVLLQFLLYIILYVQQYQIPLVYIYRRGGGELQADPAALRGAAIAIWKAVVGRSGQKSAQTDEAYTRIKCSLALALACLMHTGNSGCACRCCCTHPPVPASSNLRYQHVRSFQSASEIWKYKARKEAERNMRQHLATN